MFETSDETTVGLSSTRIQPIAADVDVAVVEASTARHRPPLQGIRSIAGADGPEDEQEVGP